jgi:hypothetical protein
LALVTKEIDVMAKKTNEVSGWVGWVGFASVVMYLLGFFHIIAGFAALLNDKVYVVGQEYYWVLDKTQWGWVHIIGGLLAIWAASSLLQGHAYGRTVAVLVALTSAAANMAFIPIYPVWSIMMVVVAVLVLWAVTVHGGELKD